MLIWLLNQFRQLCEPSLGSCQIPGLGEFTGVKTSIYLEVEGAGDYLPSYSGNLDIMTAAAKATGELLAQKIMDRRAAA